MDTGLSIDIIGPVTHFQDEKWRRRTGVLKVIQSARPGPQSNIIKIEKSLQKSLQLNINTGLILKDAESCALYNPLNKGNNRIYLRF